MSVNAFCDRVGEDERAADHRHAEHDGEGGEQRRGSCARRSPLSATLDHRAGHLLQRVEDRVGAGGPRSLTMLPSARNRTRSAIAAACASWVTITVVWPSSRPSRAGASRISPLVRESRLPVGSSANTTVGRETSARAIATRCCWPPESSDGPVRDADRRGRPWRSARRPTRGPACGRRARAGAGCSPRAVSIGSRLKNWKTKPMCSRRSRVSSLSPSAVIVGAVDPHLARGRPVEPGEDVHERRLARARRAHDRGQLALGDRQRDAAQGVDGRVAVAVAAAEVTRGEADGRLRVLGRVLRAEKSVRQCFHRRSS